MLLFQEFMFVVVYCTAIHCDVRGGASVYKLKKLSRATVYNLFLIAKVWHILHALCMSHINVKPHRVFTAFISS